MFRGSVRSTGYPHHSPVSPSLHLPCVTVCHHISTGVYQLCRPAADTSSGSFVPKSWYLRSNIRRVTTEGNNHSEGRALLSTQISRHSLIVTKLAFETSQADRQTALGTAQGGNETSQATHTVRSQYSEGPATGHLDTGFSWFPCVYKQMLRWFPTFQVTTTCFSCSSPDLNLLVTNFIFCIHVK